LRNVTHEQEGLYPRAVETAPTLRMDSLPG
jgi:hypothetical protein